MSGDTHTTHDIRSLEKFSPLFAGSMATAEALAVLIDQSALTGALRALQNEVASLRREIREIKEHGNPQSSPDFLRLKEVATRLNLSTKSVRRLVDDGLLRRMAGYRHILILSSDVSAYQQKALLTAPPA